MSDIMFASISVALMLLVDNGDWANNAGDACGNWISQGLSYLSIWIEKPHIIFVPLLSIVVAGIIRHTTTYTFRVSTKTDVLLSLPTDFAFLSFSVCASALLIANKPVTMPVFWLFCLIFSSYVVISLICGLTRERMYTASVALAMQAWWKFDKKHGYSYFKQKVQPIWTVVGFRGEETEFKFRNDIEIPQPSRKFWLTLLGSIILYGITITVLGNVIL